MANQFFCVDFGTSCQRQSEIYKARILQCPKSVSYNKKKKETKPELKKVLA